MKYLLVVLLFAAGVAEALPVVPVCPATVGTLALHVTRPRSTCISPCLIFFDATTTTDTSIIGNTTVFQDVTFTWDFGDTLPSGRKTWAYGSNPGVNSRNAATGAIAAHLFVTQGRDAKFTVKLTVKDPAGNTAVCGVGVTAFDPSGANGFPGSTTTCVGATTLPVAGVGGCPTGAAVLTQSNYNTALTSKFGSSKRVLFKCGDTFTGNDYTVNAVKGSIGAYGGCEGTQVSRPIFNTSGTSQGALLMNQTGSVGDIRVSDIDFEGAGTGGGAINSGGTCCHPSYQITLSNLNTTGNSSGYAYQQGAQWGLIELVQTNARGIATFLNFGENNPPYTGSTVNNLDYTALIGSHISGCGLSCGGGTEDVRISACRLCVLENNDMVNSNSVGSDLKLHNGNTTASCCLGSGCAPPCTVSATFANINCWTGIYTELIMITDNYFGPNGGGSGPEMAPQNGGCDERLRNIVVERNVIAITPTANEGPMSYFAGQNITVRDNVCNIGTVSGGNYNGTCYMPLTRGGTGLPIPNPYTSQFQEFYNNTCFMPAGNLSNQSCLNLAFGTSTPPTNSFVGNTMSYSVGASRIVVQTGGAGNTYGSATANSSVNPGFTNVSGTMLLVSDFKPTTNYSGGASVPVIYDALGVLWPPTWDLGAVHH